MQAGRFYMSVVAFFLASLVVGVVFFLSGLDDRAYRVSNGVGYGLHYIDKLGYDSYLQGFVFTLSFLIAGVLLLVLIMLPQGKEQAASAFLPPQPQRHFAAPTVSAPTPSPFEPPEPERPLVGGGVWEEALERASAAPEPLAQPVPKPRKAVEKEIDPLDLIEEEPEDEEEYITDYDKLSEGVEESDVVYGKGKITEDALWHFVYNYPESTVKFLYRKTMDGRSLNPADEDIHREWEHRAMSRRKIRKIVLEMMGWKALPKGQQPYMIWRELRDKVFEMNTKEL